MKQRKLGTSHLEAGLISWCVSQLRDEPGKLSFSYHMLRKTRKKKNQDLFPFHFLSPPTICSCARLWLLLRKRVWGKVESRILQTGDSWRSARAVFSPCWPEAGTPNSVELSCFVFITSPLSTRGSHGQNWCPAKLQGALKCRCRSDSLQSGWI